VQLSYDVEIGAAIEKRELPFVVGILADLSGQPSEPLPRLRDRKFVSIDVDNFDSVMGAMRPHLAFNVACKLTEEDIRLKVDLQFRGLEDFEPQNVVRQVMPLRALLDLRTKLADLRGTLDTNDRFEAVLIETFSDPDRMEAIRMELEVWRGTRIPEPQPEEANSALVTVGSPLWALLDQANLRLDAAGRERTLDILRTFMEEVLNRQVVVQRDAQRMIDSRIAEIDQLLSLQTREILHSQEFQRLEASWRALAYLVRNTETSPALKIKVLNASKKELLRDLQKAAEFDQSALFKKVYEEEFGVFGGEPFAVLVGDFEFSRNPEEIELLAGLTQIAASAHAPFLAAAAPGLFNLESFRELGVPRDLAKIFDSTDYARWRAFRYSEDARYATLVVPRMLMRMPYGRDGVAVADFDFDEGIDGTDHNLYLWASGAFGLATRLTKAFAVYGWSAAIRGVEGGGVVADLPVHTYQTDEGDFAIKCPTEIAITDRREKELSDLGFVPLVHCKGTDFACFFSAQTCGKPPIYDVDTANAAARASAQLPFVLAVSRFAHYLKAMMRDKIGNFMTRSECERYLNAWITQYVTSDDDAPLGTRARLPLKMGRVEVTEVRGKPGTYMAVAFLLPNFQLERLETPLRVAMQLPRPLY
jgi:type VI secretion system protein ImpC